MFRMTGREAKLKELRALETVRSADGGEPRVRVRLSLEVAQLANDELGQLPCGLAARALAEDGLEQGEIEGPNTTTLTVRRAFPVLAYTIARAVAAATFDAAVVNRPALKVVEGVPALHWTVEATMPAADAATLLGCLRSDLTTLTVRPLQMEISLPSPAPEARPRRGRSRKAVAEAAAVQ